MVRHPLPEVVDHVLDGFVGHVGMVRGDAENLRPALTAGVLEGTVHVFEGLVDLLV